MRFFLQAACLILQLLLLFFISYRRYTQYRFQKSCEQNRLVSVRKKARKLRRAVARKKEKQKNADALYYHEKKSPERFIGVCKNLAKKTGADLLQIRRLSDKPDCPRFEICVGCPSVHRYACALKKYFNRKVQVIMRAREGVVLL